MSDETWWTVEEIARRYRLTERAVYDLISRGKIKAVRFQRRLRVSQKELERYEREYQTKKEPEPCM